MNEKLKESGQLLREKVRELEGFSREYGYQKALSETMKFLKMLVRERNDGEIGDEDLIEVLISEMSFMSERGIKESKKEVIEFEKYKKYRRLSK